jgi:hypothetical protein
MISFIVAFISLRILKFFEIYSWYSLLLNSKKTIIFSIIFIAYPISMTGLIDKYAS